MTTRELWNTIIQWKEDGVPNYDWINKSNEKHKMPIHYIGDVGIEHYCMLAAIVNIISNENVVDIGTYQGCSALEMAANPNVNVISYDITNRLKKLPKEDNIEYKVENLIRTKKIPETRIIMFDVDPHDAIQEPLFMELFKSFGYKGLIICDDIHLTTHMNDWWNSIENEKIDISSIGHHSGTGLIYYE